VQLERKRSEEQTLLLDNIETQIWYLTDIETYGAVNKARADFLGLEKSNLEGRNIYDIQGREEAEVCIAGNREVFENKKQVHTEDWVKNGRGETRLLAIARTPKLDEKGEVEYVICAAEGITERKKAEEEEKQHRKRMDLLSKTAMRFVEFSPDEDIYRFIGEQLKELTGDSIVAINSIDKDSSILVTRAVLGLGKFSESIIKLLGKHPEGMSYNGSTEDLYYLSDGRLHDYGKSLYDVFLKTIPKPACDAVEKNCKVGKKYTIGFTKERELFGTAVIFLPKGAELGDKMIIEAFIKQAAIALQRKSAEEALREAEEQFRTIVETAPSFLMIIDAERNNTYVSPNCEELTGYTEEELLGSGRWWVHEDDTPKAKELFERTFQDGVGSRDFEYKAVKKNGGLWYASSSWEPLKDGEGKFRGIVFQTIDVTERKKAEDQIKASLKEKEVLLREIHHRVRNNLQIMSSLLTMQVRATNNKDTIDQLTESRNRINAMTLIHNQLYESKDMSEINMKDFVEKLLRLMFQNYQVQETKINTIVHVADCPLPISLAVPTGLIVNELLTNAFKYAFVNRKSGKIEVVLRTSEKGVVSLTVSDDGVGLPEGFDINTTKTLGLRVVKILAESQLQGNLDVVSDIGAAFTVEFEMEKE
jgi:PAS domain S-box-containing protein